MNKDNWNPELYTKRLSLRRLTSDDAKAILQLRSSLENLKYVQMKRYESVERANKFIKGLIKDIDEREVCYWGLEEKEKQTIIGTVCLWNFSENGKIGEIGYELLPEKKGKGYMNEALAQVIEYGFNTLQLESIWAITHRLHTKSIALLEKFNFSCKGVASEYDAELDEGPDMLLYVLNKS